MTAPVQRADHTPPPAPSFIRPVLGFLAGLGVTVLISAPGVVIATLAALRGTEATKFVATPGYLVVSVAILAIGAMAGGFTTARLTVGRSFYSVFLLAIVLVTALVSQAVKGTPKPGEPSWYPMCLAVIIGTSTLVGGALQRRGAARRSLAG